MTKLEEVARAIASAKFGRPISDDMWQTMVRQYRELSIEPQYLNDRSFLMDSFREARAAIEALRTPTPEMLEAGCAAYEPSLGEDRFVSETGIERVWNAMLARALKDA